MRFSDVAARWLAAILTCAAAAFTVSACGGDDESASKGAAGKQYTIGVMMNTADNPYISSMVKSLRQTCAKVNLKCIEEDGQFDASLQANQVENLINRRVDGVLFFPVDVNTVTPMLTKLKAANIPVVSYGNRVLDKDLPLVRAAVDEDSHREGAEIGKQVCEDVPSKPIKVAMIEGLAGGWVATQRSKGFEEAIQQCPNVKIVARQPADFDRAKALRATEDMLQRHPDIDAIYAHDDNMAMGALDAVKGAKKLGQIKVYGIGGMGEFLDAIKAGDTRATVFQSPVQFGTLPVLTMRSILEGKQVPKFRYLEIPRVTRENVDEIPRQW
jgi:ribose transport system substrate-binding protein